MYPYVHLLCTEYSIRNKIQLDGTQSDENVLCRSSGGTTWRLRTLYILCQHGGCNTGLLEHMHDLETTIILMEYIGLLRYIMCIVAFEYKAQHSTPHCVILS